jgi:Family of unknown function (DUF6444)
VATSIPLPAGLALDATSWRRTSRVVRQVIVQLLTVIQQQAARIAALEARLSQHSSNSDRPPSSDPPYAKHPVRSGGQGRPGAKPRHPGHRQTRLEPTEVIKVTPEACPCGQAFSVKRRNFHIPSDLVVAVCHCSSKAPRREDLEIEEPVRGGDSAAFHFHPTLTGMLGATLIRHQIVQVR